MIGHITIDTCKALKFGGTALGLLVLSTAAVAQQSMTVEELEAYIDKKKTELTEAIEQRDATVEKQTELEKKQAEQLERQEEIEQELRDLCDEREEAEPGSLSQCLSEMNLDSE